MAVDINTNVRDFDWFIPKGSYHLVKTSGGIIYAVVAEDDGQIQVMKANADPPTSFTAQDTANNPDDTKFEGAACAIDSSDIIHIIYYKDDVPMADTSIKYAVFNTGSDTFTSINENVMALVEDTTFLGVFQGLAIAVDVNDIPHVLISDNIKDMGSTKNARFYANRIGGSWNSRVQVTLNSAANQSHFGFELLIGIPTTAINEDRPLITDVEQTSTVATADANHGNALNATAFTTADDITGSSNPRNEQSIGMSIDEDGFITFAYAVDDGDLEYVRHDPADAWSTWSSPADIETGSSHQNIDARSLFDETFVSSVTAGDVKFFHERGRGGTWSEWTKGPPPEVGTFNHAGMKYAKHNDNESTEFVDYAWHELSSLDAKYNRFRPPQRKTHTTSGFLRQVTQERTFTQDSVIGGPHLINVKSANTMNGRSNMVKLKNGTLYCAVSTNDVLETDANDNVELEIEMRKSLDNGKTWSNPLDLANQPDGNDFVHASIAIDSAEEIKLAFIEVGASTTLHYRTFNTTTDTWSSDTTIFTGTGGLGNNVVSCSIAVDINDDVHIAFNSGNANTILRYTNNITGGGTTFKATVLVELTTDNQRPKLIFDEDNFPFIITVEPTVADVKVHGGNAINATSFTTFILEGASITAARSPGIAKRRNGDMLAAFLDTNQDLNVRRHVNGSAPATWDAIVEVSTDQIATMETFAIGDVWFIIAYDLTGLPDVIKLFRVSGSGTLTITELANDLFPLKNEDPPIIEPTIEFTAIGWANDHAQNYGFPPQIDASQRLTTLPAAINTQELTYHIFSNVIPVKAHTTDAFLSAPVSPAVTEDHTTDAFLKRAVAHTTDAFLIRAIAHSTDAFLIRAIAHTTDSFLIRAIAHSTDAFLKRAIAHSTDALLLAHFEITHTTDAFLKKAIAHSTDAFLKRALAHSTDATLRPAVFHTTDAFLKRAIAHSTDAFLRIALAHSTDALLLAHQTLIHTTDAVIKRRISLTHTTDALLKKLGITLTHTTDSILKKLDNLLTHSTDTFLRRAIAHTTDSFLKRAIAHSTDAFRKRAIAHSTDALLQAHFELLHTTDASLKRAIAHSTNSFLKRAIAHSTDAFLISVGALTHTTDALLEAHQELTHTTDSFLKRAIAHSTDAFLKRAIAHSTDALLLAHQILTHTTNALLKKLDNLLTHTTDAILEAHQELTHTTDAFLIRALAHTTDAFLIRAIAHTTDSFLKKALAHSTDAFTRRAIVHTTDSFLLGVAAVLTHTTDAILRTKISLTHSTDSILQPLIFHRTDAFLAFVRTRTHTTDSLLEAHQTLTHSTDAILADLEVILTHSTDAVLGDVFARTHTTNATLKKHIEITHTTDSFLAFVRTLTHTTDRFLAAPVLKTITHTTSGFLRSISQTRIHQTDAYLSEPGKVSLHHFTDAVLGAGVEHTTDSFFVIQNIPFPTHTTDSILKTVGFLHHNTSAILFKFGVSLTHTTDATLISIKTLTHTTDAFIQNTPLFHTTDAFLLLPIGLFHTTDSILGQFEGQRTHTTDSFRRLRGLTVTHTTDAFKQSSNLLTHTTDAFKLKKASLTHNTDGFLQLVAEPSHITDAALQKFDLEITHQTDAYLGVVIRITHNTDSVLQEMQNLRTHTTDARLTGSFVGAFAKVILKRQDRKLVIFKRITKQTTIFARQKRNTGVLQ